MEKYLGKEYADRADRTAFLKDSCDGVEQKGYMKPYTPDELQGRKEKLVELSIKIEETENEKKNALKGFNAALDPMKKESKEMVRDIRQKAEYVHEICYKFVDREERETGYYNADGDLIECRRATADELQAIPFSVQMKTGTDD